MRNLLKIFAVFMVVFSSFAFGQKILNNNADDILSSSTTDRTIKLICVTYSCCGIGPFGVEIWSDRECNYIVYNKGGNTANFVLNLKDTTGNNYTKNLLEVKEDVLLNDYNKTLDDGFGYVMKAGFYKVINGQVAFTASVERIRYICLKETHEGQFFGHEYSYTTYSCIFYLSNKANYATLDLSNEPKLLELARENDNILEIDEDITIENKSLEPFTTFTIKAGRYPVNEDGKIYLRNLLMK